MLLFYLLFKKKIILPLSAFQRVCFQQASFDFPIGQACSNLYSIRNTSKEIILFNKWAIKLNFEKLWIKIKYPFLVKNKYANATENFNFYKLY